MFWNDIKDIKKGIESIKENGTNQEYREKIDYLCENVSKIAEKLQKQDKKPRKPPKIVKKKWVSLGPLSE